MTQPSDPERPFDGGTIETSVDLSPADAKKFADGILLAIAAAEKEISLRSKLDRRRAEREAKAKLKAPKAKQRAASATEPATPPVRLEGTVKPKPPGEGSAGGQRSQGLTRTRQARGAESDAR